MGSRRGKTPSASKYRNRVDFREITDNCGRQKRNPVSCYFL